MTTTMFTQIKSAFLTWSLCEPVTIQTAHVDGYGDFGDELTNEMQSAAMQSAPQNHSLEIEPEEFETAYGWFYS